MTVTTELTEFEEKRLRELGLDRATARAATLPYQTGDGYGYGGGAIVVIGSLAVVVGEGEAAHLLAKEIEARWNRFAD